MKTISASLRKKWLLPVIVLTAFLFAGCRIYSFRDASIPTDIKTIKIGYIQNRARYVNPQLSGLLTDKLLQKVTSQSRRKMVASDDADYVINGEITNYDATQTVGVSALQASINRLTVSVHITFRDAVHNKTNEYDVSRSFDFSANLTLQQAESQLLDEVIRTMADEIFNRIFSNW